MPSTRIKCKCHKWRQKIPNNKVRLYHKMENNLIANLVFCSNWKRVSVLPTNAKAAVKSHQPDKRSTVRITLSHESITRQIQISNFEHQRLMEWMSPSRDFYQATKLWMIYPKWTVMIKQTWLLAHEIDMSPTMSSNWVEYLVNMRSLNKEVIKKWESHKRQRLMEHW